MAGHVGQRGRPPPPLLLLCGRDGLRDGRRVDGLIGGDGPEARYYATLVVELHAASSTSRDGLRESMLSEFKSCEYVRSYFGECFRFVNFFRPLGQLL